MLKNAGIKARQDRLSKMSQSTASWAKQAAKEFGENRIRNSDRRIMEFMAYAYDRHGRVLTPEIKKRYLDSLNQCIRPGDYKALADRIRDDVTFGPTD